MGSRRAWKARYHGEYATHLLAESTRILLSFCCVYFFWGATYLAMRFGVEVLPPFLLASARFLIAAPLMLALRVLR